jgi:hypothetical protein
MAKPQENQMWINEIKDSKLKQSLKRVQSYGLKYERHGRLESVIVLQWASEALRQGVAYEDWQSAVKFMALPAHLRVGPVREISQELKNLV